MSDTFIRNLHAITDTFKSALLLCFNCGNHNTTILASRFIVLNSYNSLLGIIQSGWLCIFQVKIYHDFVHTVVKNLTHILVCMRIKTERGTPDHLANLSHRCISILSQQRSVLLFRLYGRDNTDFPDPFPAKKCTCWRAQGQSVHSAQSFISLLWFTLLWHHLPLSHMHNNVYTFYTLFCPSFLSFIHHLLILHCIHSVSSSSPPCLILLNLVHNVTSDLGLKAMCLHTILRYWSSHMSVCIGMHAILHVRTYDMSKLALLDTLTNTHIPSRSFQARSAVCVWRGKRIFAFLSFPFSRLRCPLAGWTRHISHCQGPCRLGTCHGGEVRELW